MADAPPPSPPAAPADDGLRLSLLSRLALPDEAAAGAGFTRAGCLVGLVGFEDGPSERVDDLVAELGGRSLTLASRPVGAGGLLLALARLCIAGPDAIGCAVVLPAPRHVGAGEPPSIEQQLFHEAPGRRLLCIPADRQADARLLASEHGVPLWPLGRTGGRELVVRASEGEQGFREVVRVSLADLLAACGRPAL